MPPRRYSRYTGSAAVLDDDGNLVLTERTPFRFRNRADNRLHVVREGDTPFSLAATYFPSFPRPAGLYWVIADYQPDPIVDVTIALEVGRLLYIPAERVVREEILAGLGG